MNELKRVNEAGHKALRTLARSAPELFMQPDAALLQAKMQETAGTAAVWQDPIPLGCSLEPLNELDASGPGTDEHYAKIMRQALADISLADAADDLLWASINCFAIANYVPLRWQTGLTSNTNLENFVDAHWLKGGSDGRRANAAARLWWLGEISERVAQHSKYSADALLNVMANNVNLYHQTLSRPYLLANARLVAAIYEAAMDGNTHLYQTRYANLMLRSLNVRAGAAALDLMDAAELKAVVAEAIPPKA